ncbi:MAG: trypsin-like peptidase domain-containing protein [Kineosporiaceae bacterium]
MGAGLDDDRVDGSLPPAPAPVSGQSGQARPRDSVAGIAAAILPSVVALRVTSSDGTATGSGFVIRADGYILTNNHVVASAPKGDSVVVIFQDGTRVNGNVVGKDASYDLAVVRIKRGGLVPLRLADSAKVAVGDPVIAVGAPLGLQGTVTTGIVSATNRPVAAGGEDAQQESSFINAIQTDAAINPGNSGGPLLDADGSVVGINSAIARAPGSVGGAAGSIGLGFAIPSNQARRTSEQLIRQGKADHPVIGVLLDREYDGEGVKVAETSSSGQPPVTKGGPADKAGIKPGDLIVAFNGRPVAAPDELVVAIRAQAPGDTVTLTVRRGDRDRQVKVTLVASGD